jgi:hypothetical protein
MVKPPMELLNTCILPFGGRDVNKMDNKPGLNKQILGTMAQVVLRNCFYENPVLK